METSKSKQSQMNNSGQDREKNQHFDSERNPFAGNPHFLKRNTSSNIASVIEYCRQDTPAFFNKGPIKYVTKSIQENHKESRDEDLDNKLNGSFGGHDAIPQGQFDEGKMYLCGDTKYL